ncbi:MAG TPA: ABC transporter substrate-binding protein [Longimicrobiales bacterium]|nr:ABC transporter substrate-binding protein [Longimicrobiales bacterium]
MNGSRRWWTLLLPVVLACGDREPAGEAAIAPQRGGTVVVVNNTDLDNMNTLLTQNRYTQEVSRYLLFLPLVHYGPELEYVPSLAERWELLGDTGVVFHLRHDVRWHDGVQTTARDVVFTYERARDPETAFPNAEYFVHWTGVTAPDSFTVRFSFVPHLDPMAGLPFLPIMPAHLLDSIPSSRLQQAAFNKRPVGNGPFRFVEQRTNDRWIFEANPDHPEALGGRPYIDRLVYRPVPEASVQVTEVSTGGADLALNPPSTQFAQLSQQPGLRGVARSGRQYASVIWNGRVEPFDNAAVRRALTYAIDRRQILETLRAGHGDLAAGPIGPYHWAYDDALQPLPFNVDSARALLAQAGIRDIDGDSILELPNGRDFTIEVKIPAGSEITRNMAEMIRANLSAIGVRITTRQTDFATLIEDITSPRRNFQATIVAWESDFRINLRDIFHSSAIGTPNQTASYGNPRVDSLIDRAGTARTREEAKPVYAELQRILRDEQPWTFLYYYPDLVLMRDRLQGADMDVRGAFVNVQKWWVTDPQPARSDSADRGPARDSAPAR